MKFSEMIKQELSFDKTRSNEFCVCVCGGATCGVMLTPTVYLKMFICFKFKARSPCIQTSKITFHNRVHRRLEVLTRRRVPLQSLPRCGS